jgi:hypothetical protein
MKAQKREEQRVQSRPVVECEKCRSVITLSNYHSHLKSCDGVYDQNHLARAYRNSKKLHMVERSREHQKVYRHKRKEECKNYVNTFKEEQGCLLCSEHCYHVIDTHHVYPENKKDTLSDLVERGTLKRVKEELAKCVCLCRCCHQKVEVKIVTLLPWSLF